MRVFRLCTEEELINLSLGETIGKEYNETKSSTHIYEKGKKYLHFYYDNVFAFYKGLESGEYLCEFHFPNEYDIYRGKGSYKTKSGYEHFIEVDELSLPSELVSYDNIVDIVKIVGPDYNTELEYISEIYNYVEHIDKEEQKELAFKKN